jgi:hypothetical protein
MSTSRRRFRLVRFLAALAGVLGVVAMAGCAASASSSGDVPGASSSGDVPGAVRPARGAPAVVSGGRWRKAEEVPGTAALNKRGNAEVISVSCASPGSCSGGGSYRDASRRDQAFVVDETNGTWETAKEVPGTAALNTGGLAEVTSVSCASAGNCSAGGFYQDGSTNAQAFVASETAGIWHAAKEVPGTAALNTGGDAEVTSVSCAQAGNCAAGGEFRDRAGHQQAFVASQTNGIWHTAEEVPGTAALNTGGAAETASVSCASAGNCAAGGDYTDSAPNGQAFVASETDGIWRTAEEVPGTAALNTSGSAEILSVSCASAGTCSAGGVYDHSSAAYEYGQAFVASETNGIWHAAKEVPGTAALNTGGAAETASVSCASAGNCAAGGFYLDSSGNQQAFVASEANGIWRTAEEVPGTAALNTGGGAEILSVSCAQAGTCSAGGDYMAQHEQAFVVDETKGIWRTAEEVPGTAALNTGGGAEILSVSCAPAGTCSAGGQYLDNHHFGQQAFVDNKDLVGPGLRESRRQRWCTSPRGPRRSCSP